MNMDCKTEQKLRIYLGSEYRKLKSAGTTSKKTANNRSFKASNQSHYANLPLPKIIHMYNQEVSQMKILNTRGGDSRNGSLYASQYKYSQRLSEEKKTTIKNLAMKEKYDFYYKEEFDFGNYKWAVNTGRFLGNAKNNSVDYLERQSYLSKGSLMRANIISSQGEEKDNLDNYNFEDILEEEENKNRESNKSLMEKIQEEEIENEFDNEDNYNEIDKKYDQSVVEEEDLFKKDMEKEGFTENISKITHNTHTTTNNKSSNRKNMAGNLFDDLNDKILFDEIERKVMKTEKIFERNRNENDYYYGGEILDAKAKIIQNYYRVKRNKSAHIVGKSRLYIGWDDDGMNLIQIYVGNEEDFELLTIKFYSKEKMNSYCEVWKVSDLFLGKVKVNRVYFTLHIKSVINKISQYLNERLAASKNSFHPAVVNEESEQYSFSIHNEIDKLDRAHNISDNNKDNRLLEGENSVLEEINYEF